MRITFEDKILLKLMTIVGFNPLLVKVRQIFKKFTYLLFKCKLNMSPLYFKIMTVLAKSLAYPQRIYHSVRSSQNPAIRIFTPFVLLITLLLSLPAFTVATITMMLEMKKQSQPGNVGLGTNSSTEEEKSQSDKEQE
jgi:hypothetical protein